MHRTWVWCVSTCLVGAAAGAAAAQQPGRPDPRVQALKDSERLPANRIPGQADAHSFAQQADTHQLLSKTADASSLVSKSAAIQMSTESDAKRLSLAGDFSRDLGQAKSLLRERPGTLSFTPEPGLRPNRLSLPPLSSSLLQQSVPGRFGPAPTLKVPENYKLFQPESATSRFSGTSSLKLPENHKQFIDRE